VVPDTLDLADRARLAINAIVGEIEPKFNHECWWLLTLLPPSVSPHTNQWFDQNPRNLWALVLLRIMTGIRLLVGGQLPDPRRPPGTGGRRD
jgi:hypothetical protein